MYDVSAIQPHVPSGLVRDIDPYNLEGSKESAVDAWAKVQLENPDIFFMPRYSGFWLVTRKALFDRILLDPENFSSVGAAIFPPLPEGTPPFNPLQTDPPEHKYFRHPFNVSLSPKNVIGLAARAREVVNECIDKFIENGSCEFMHDVAMHVPVAIVMQIFDLPYEDRERLIPMVDVITHCQDPAKRGEAIGGIAAYADEWVSKREQAPGDDAISLLLKTKIGDDRTMTHNEVVATVTLLLLGGLDSVSHTMGVIMKFLAEHPDYQRQIGQNPAIIPDALDELLRRWAISITTRTATRDIELNGVQLKQGDKVMLVLPLAGTDEQAWPHAMTVDFSRKPRGYLNFGSGIHKCVGLNLARAELTALLQEWFKRIPEFTITPGDKAATTGGQIQGVTHLPLSWKVG